MHDLNPQVGHCAWNVRPRVWGIWASYSSPRDSLATKCSTTTALGLPTVATIRDRCTRRRHGGRSDSMQRKGYYLEDVIELPNLGPIVPSPYYRLDLLPWLCTFMTILLPNQISADQERPSLSESAQYPLPS